MPSNHSVEAPEICETLPDEKWPAVAPDQYTPYQKFAETRRMSHPHEEIFAVEFYYPGAGAGGVIQISVDADTATLQAFAHVDKDDKVVLEPLGHRQLQSQEVSSLRAFIAKNNIDHLPRQEMGGFDGIEYRWTHIRDSQAWQVLMNNPQKNEHPQQDLLVFIKGLQNARPLDGGRGVDIYVAAEDPDRNQ